MNFALILFLLVVLTFAAWLAEKAWFLPRRRRLATQRVAEFERTQAALPPAQRVADPAAASVALADAALRQPLWLEYTAGLFPVIAAVFLLGAELVYAYTHVRTGAKDKPPPTMPEHVEED